jgi:hypothetical protein
MTGHRDGCHQGPAFYRVTTESDNHCGVLDHPFMHRSAWYYIHAALNINPWGMVLD